MNTVALVELLVLLFGEVVFALSLLKGDEANLVIFGKALNRVDKLASSGLDHVSRSHFVPAVDAIAGHKR